MTEEKTYPRFATFLLAFSMFTTGASGLVSEFILSTVSTYILGNSIEQFSIVIALMMFMMGIAGVAQKYFDDNHLLVKFFIVESLLALFAGYAPLALYAAFGYMVHFELAQYTLICVIGFLIGFEIPLVLRINDKYSKTLGTNLASIYAADYLGAFVGAMIWTFYLLRNFPLTHISFMLAGTNFAVACITILYFQWNKIDKMHKNIIPGLLILMVVPLLFWGFVNNQTWAKLMEQKLYDDKIVFTETTKYQHLVMTLNKKMEEYRFYINGNLQWASSDEVIYHELLVHPVMNMVKDHERVLILGGGDGMALRELLTYDDVKEIMMIDLDPEMTKFSANNEILRKLNRNAFA
ncbi:MAG: hypothetical protein KAS32_05715, partial [Candidatus Peribacteraceae bacterium]|nr:hypothetical protein [Candidatus Peribacteraceae bacterium]